MIPFVRDMDFAYGRPDRVSPLVRRVVAPNPGPFTFRGTGTYIVGHGEVAVIDPGPDLPGHLEALLDALKGDRVRAVLVTHTHLDHSPLSAALARAVEAPVYGRPAPGGPDAEIRLDEGQDRNFRPDAVVEDGQRVSGEGWTLEAMSTPGHASNHVCYALAEENALFTGDHVMGWSTTVVSPPDGDMGAYYASLDKVAARGFATLWPTHGPPVRDVEPFLTAYKAHRLERERQILEQLSAGRVHIPEMVRAIYADVDPGLHPAASQSVLAHLIHLTSQGRVASDSPPSLLSAYRSPAG